MAPTRMTFPPTPASSTDIKGQDGSGQLSNLQTLFELPPPAISTNDLARISPVDANLSPSSPELLSGTSPTKQLSASYPVQPSEAVKSRRRSSAAAQKPLPQPQETFALPPPPTRSRKIIQMKMKTQTETMTAVEATNTTPTGKAAGTGNKGAGAGAGAAAAGTAGSVATTAAGAATTTTGSRKKQPSATSAAGRKIARKTAHSLIERRRRSKMNEEFAVLKGMIPACTGEMHKLAILQASIEYVRYLEDCVAKLKAQQSSQARSEFDQLTPYAPRPASASSQEDGSGDVDVEMTGSSALPSPAFPPANPSSHQPSVSPALLAEDSRRRQESYSSSAASTTADRHHRHYSFGGSSTATSPAMGPQQHGPATTPLSYPSGFARGSLSAAGSALTSPALGPQRDLDQEATAALLMLNADRRASNAGTQLARSGNGTGRGMSVRDLLST